MRHCCPDSSPLFVPTTHQSFSLQSDFQFDVSACPCMSGGAIGRPVCHIVRLGVDVATDRFSSWLSCLHPLLFPHSLRALCPFPCLCPLSCPRSFAAPFFVVLPFGPQAPRSENANLQFSRPNRLFLVNRHYFPRNLYCFRYEIASLNLQIFLNI